MCEELKHLVTELLCSSSKWDLDTRLNLKDSIAVLTKLKQNGKHKLCTYDVNKTSFKSKGEWWTQHAVGKCNASGIFDLLQ